MKERLFFFSILLTSVPLMETSILIIVDLLHFRGQFLPVIHNFVKQTNKQTKENQHFQRGVDFFFLRWSEMGKSYVLLADGSFFANSFSFVISHSWRSLYTCGYLWDSSSKDLLMSFLTSSGVFSKKDTKSFVRCSSSRALFKASS